MRHEREQTFVPMKGRNSSKKKRRRRLSASTVLDNLESQAHPELQLPPEGRRSKFKWIDANWRIQRIGFKSPERTRGSGIHVVEAHEVGAVEDIESFSDEIYAGPFRYLEPTAQAQINIKVIRPL